MNTQLFDKTDKGREEIATRQYHLPPRMRTLLLLVDGKSTADQVLQKVTGLGLNESALVELLEQHFIKESGITSADEQAILEAITDSSAESDADLQDAANTEVAAATEVAPASQVADVTEATGVTEIAAPFVPTPISPEVQALHEFFSATIKSLLGLSGAAFQIKADKAASIDEFKALREPYLAAILNAGGPEMARILANQLDQLLQSKP